MRSRRILTALALALSCALAISALVPSFASRKQESKIVLIGLDAARNSISAEIPADEYEQDLSMAMGAVRRSVVPVLSRHKVQVAKATSRWRLDSVAVGIGLAGTIGLGPIISVSVSPQLRLVFSDHVNSILPN